MAPPVAAAAPPHVDTWHQWAYGVLNGIGAPITQTNLQTLWNWSLKESGQNVMRWNNPLNTTQAAPGATSQNSVGVKAYPTVGIGTNATVQTLTNGRYPAIVAALKGSVPTSQWSKSKAIVDQLGTWGSGSNWLTWKNSVPPWVNSSVQSSSSGGSDIIKSILPSNPLDSVGQAINTAEQNFVKTLGNLVLMGTGAVLMLAGLALIAYAAIQRAPEPVKRLASAASNLTPQGRAVTVARAATPKAAPATEARPTKAPLSPAAESAVREARAGRGSKLSPEVKSELRRAS